jgi:transposase
MSQRRELTEFEQGEIIGLWKGGHSERNIEEILGHPKSTIHGTIISYKISGQITASSRSGRPPKFTAKDVRHLVKTLKEDRQQSLEEMTKKFSESLSISVFSNTIKRTLHFERFFG